VRGLRGGKLGFWRAGVAYAAAIALLFQALLFPAGCVAGAHEDAAEALLAGLSGALCTAHQDDGGKGQSGDGTSKHDRGACCFSAACCGAVLAANSSQIEFKPAGNQVFVPEAWRAPAGTAIPAPRNRGPPIALLA